MLIAFVSLCVSVVLPLLAMSASLSAPPALSSDPTLERSFRGHKGAVTSVSFSPSLRQLASGAHDHIVMVWNFKPQLRAFRFMGHKVSRGERERGRGERETDIGDETQKEGRGAQRYVCVLLLCVVQGAVTSVEFSPTGHLLASASTDNTVRLWEPTVRGKCSILKAHSAPVRSVSWSSDARLLITSSDDKTCKVWGSSGARFWCSLVGHTNWVRSAVLSRDTRLAASASDDKTVKLWDVHTHACVQTFFDHSLPVRSVKFHPHGSVIASAGADNSIKLYDLRSQAMIQHYTAHDSVVNSIDFHPSGDYLLSGSDDSSLKIWDLREGHQLYTIHGHKGATLGVTWSPEGDFFASAGADQRVMTWATNFDKVANLAEPTLMDRRKKVHIQPSSAEKQSREQYDAYEGQANPQFDLSGAASSQQHPSHAAPRTIHADALPGGYSTTTSLGAPSSGHGYAGQGSVPQPAPHPEIGLGHDCTYEHEHRRENGTSHAYDPHAHTQGHTHNGGPSSSASGSGTAAAGGSSLTAFSTSYPLPADHASQFLPPAGAPAVSLASDPRVTGPRLLAAAGADSSSGSVRMPDHVSAALNQIVTQLDVISRTVRAMEERLELHEQKMESLEARAIRRERNEAHMGVLEQQREELESQNAQQRQQQRNVQLRSPPRH